MKKEEHLNNTVKKLKTNITSNTLFISITFISILRLKFEYKLSIC